jgi:hypothetical protein
MADKVKTDKIRKDLKQDQLVEQLLPNPAEPQATIQLRGWLGKGVQEGSWRLYLTPQLDEYVQFQDKDILHMQPIPAEQSPLGGTLIWLPAGTSLQHTRVATRQLQADFLSGGITSSYMAGAVPAFAAAGRKAVFAVGTAGVNCSYNPHIPACQAPTTACRSINIPCESGFCHTHEFICQITLRPECSLNCGDS